MNRSLYTRRSVRAKVPLLPKAQPARKIFRQFDGANFFLRCRHIVLHAVMYKRLGIGVEEDIGGARIVVAGLSHTPGIDQHPVEVE